MAHLLRASRASLRLCSGSPKIQSSSFFSLLSRTSISTTTTSELSEETLPRSPLEANIVRILRNEIDYHSELVPTRKHSTEYKSFTVQDRPGEQWITMTRKFGDNEDIKIEATMFDDFALTPKLGDDSVGDDLHLHISLIVDISKGNELGDLEFVCSAWPNSLQVQSVYSLQSSTNLTKPYTGRDIRTLKGNFQKGFREYLEARGIDDELCVFLHDFMMNKDRIELVQWLRKVKSYVHK